MQEFLVAVVGSFFGALGGFLANLAIARRAERRNITGSLLAEFLSDSFLPHRIAVASLWRRVNEGTVNAEEVAAGFWYPGTGAYYTGELYGSLNEHQHLTAYIAYIVRLSDALDRGQLDRKTIRATLGMHLLWADSLLQQVSQAAGRQAQRHNVPIPSWIGAADRVHQELVVSANASR
ncbi:hypothetical protein [Nocardia carnea]|uniref:hypothetical protein n=1 Tax=Nocardia carnea TaxID=37328 RepID=UPI002455561E|nr:hypothetical protein [Nocardia carnea]